MPPSISKKRQLSGQTDPTSDDDSRTSSFTKSPKRSRSNSAKVMTDPEAMADSSSSSEGEGSVAAAGASTTIQPDEHGFSDMSSSSSENEGGGGQKGGSVLKSSDSSAAGESISSSEARKKANKKRKKKKKGMKRVEDTREESPESEQDYSDLEISSGSDDGADLIINLKDVAVSRPVKSPAPTSSTTTTTATTTTKSHTQTTKTTTPTLAVQKKQQPAVSQQQKKPSGAIAISVGLKLGGGKGVGGGLKIGRPTAKPMLFGKVLTSQVEVVDYSTPEKATSKQSTSRVDSLVGGAEDKETIGIAQDPSDDDGLMIIDDQGAAASLQSGAESLRSGAVSMDSNEFTALADSAVSGKASAGEDEMDESDDDDSSMGSDSDSSMASVDSFSWRRQRLYQYRQVTPELLGEGAKAKFRADESIEEAKVRLAADVPGLTKLVEKHHICDVCAGKHPTNSCEHLKCEHCSAFGEHFSFNCPTVPEKDRNSCPTCLEADGISVTNQPNEPCSHIWRSMPTIEDKAPKKLKKIPAFCYYCGQAGHFGDNCNINRSRSKDASRLSVWSRDAATEWTTMKFPGDLSINPFKKFGNAKDSPIQIESSGEEDEEDGEIDEDDEEDDGWFASRKKEVQEKIPDSKYTGMKAELPIAPSRRGGFGGGGGAFRGGGRGLPNRPNSPDRFGGPSRRRSRSPPYRGGRGGGGGGGGEGGFGRGGSYRMRDPDQPPTIRFNMGGRGRGRGGHQPPLPPGPPPSGPNPNNRGSRDFYRSGTGGKQAWQQFRR